MEGDELNLYKLVCLIVAFVVILVVVLFILKDLFVDMRSKNILQMSKKREKAKEVAKNEAFKESRFKVCKGSKKIE